MTREVFRHFVLKIASRCNLDCTYCYEYRHADQSWRSQPTRMSAAIAGAAARRIGAHVVQHRVSSIHLSFHGGEPLLVGRSEFARILDIFEEELGDRCQVSRSVQTNGLLLDEAWLGLLLEREVLVNVSLDGPAAVNDRRRLDHAGRGSHVGVARALDLLADRGRPIFAGVYAVIDVDAHPIETVDHLMRWRPNAIDLLWPDANWSCQPRRALGQPTSGLGAWLAAVFDAWFVERRWGPVLIHSFNELIKLILGGNGRLDTFGLLPSGVLCVGADGELHALDALKTAYQGASRLGVNVVDDELDTVVAHPTMRALQDRPGHLCQTCRDCPDHPVCGGGYYPHRYSPSNGFANPSVYCDDIKQLLAHITHRVHTDATYVRASCP